MRRLQLEALNIKGMQVGEVPVGVTSLTLVFKGLGVCWGCSSDHWAGTFVSLGHDAGLIVYVLSEH